MRTVRVAVFAVALLAAATAFGEQPVRFFVGATGGFGTYSLSDLNDEIDAISAASGLQMDNIKSGIAYGVCAGVYFNNAWSLEGHFDRVNGSSEIGDMTGKLEYNMPAHAFFANIVYNFPSSSPVKFGLGGGAGIISSAGKITLTATGSGSVSGDVTGSGPLAQGFLSVTIPAGNKIAISPIAGYRYAKISTVKAAGQQVYNDDGSEYSLDYSGLILRVTAKLFIN